MARVTHILPILGTYRIHETISLYKKENGCTKQEKLQLFLLKKSKLTANWQISPNLTKKQLWVFDCQTYLL